MDLSVVTTLYRSADHVAEFCRRAAAAAQGVAPDFEIILVNDGSPDDSLARALDVAREDSHVVVVDLSRNFGHHRAMMTGLAYARGARVFLIDSDLEEDPAWLAPFWERMRDGSCDAVYGVQSRRKGGWTERFSGWLFYRCFNVLSKTPIPPSATTARLMSRRYVGALLQHRERELFLPGLWELTGFAQAAMPVLKGSRGSTTYSWMRRLSLAVNALTSFSDQPLIYIFYTGAVICGLASVFILRLIHLKLFHGVPILGWPSLIVSIWFLGGLTIFFIGVLGIYLSKLFTEIKQRPYSIVRDVYPPERAETGN